MSLLPPLPIVVDTAVKILYIVQPFSQNYAIPFPCLSPLSPKQIRRSRNSRIEKIGKKKADVTQNTQTHISQKKIKKKKRKKSKKINKTNKNKNYTWTEEPGCEKYSDETQPKTGIRQKINK